MFYTCPKSKVIQSALCILGFHMQIEPTTDETYWEKNSKKCQKTKLEFAVCWQLFT